MQEPQGDAASESEPVFAQPSYLAGRPRKAAGPNPTPALSVAAIGAAVLATAGVLLRGLKISIEPGFTDTAQVIEMAVWVIVGVVIAGAALWFVYAPRKGLKLKVGHLLGMTAGALIITTLAAGWIGLPTKAQILEHKVTTIAAQARNDSTSDIMLFKSQARTEAWMSRIDPASIEKEQNLDALRKTIEGTDEYVNDYKTRLAKRRQNINTLLDVAARTPEERVHAQELYNRLTGDLTAQEDRFWDIQAQAVNLGCRLVDAVASIRAWKEAAAHGYPVRIDQAGFDTQYATYWQQMTGFRDLLTSTAKAVNTPPPAKKA